MINPSIICVRLFKISILYLFPVVLAVFHGEDTFPSQVLRIDCKYPCQAAAKRDLCSIPSSNSTTFCRMDAEEDMQDLSPLRPGLVVVLFLCPERAFQRSLPHSGKINTCRLFQQFRTAESRAHLQEHQGHFPFRSEERPASQFRPHAFLTRPKSSAISRRGSNFVSCPIRSSRKLNSRARKN